MRAFLISAYDEGMFNGEYAFLALDMVLAMGIKDNYRPELDDIIYTGVICGSVLKNSGPEYDAFATDVIEAFDHPGFAGYEHMTMDDSIDKVDTYAGMFHVLI